MRLLVLVYAHPGGEERLAAFERRALALVAEYATAVERWAGPLVLAGSEGDGPPAEVHLLTFADEQAFAAYRADPRAVALAAERDAAVRATTVIRLQ